MDPTVTNLVRYPFKGLTAEEMTRVPVTQGRAFPLDRAYALAREEGAYPGQPGRPISKAEFHTLAMHERLAGLHCRVYEDEVLTVTVHGHEVLRADLSTASGRRQASALFARVLDREGRPPIIARANGRHFTDMAEEGDDGMNFISVINVASVRDLSSRIGLEVDPLRFRGNIYVDKLPAFAENDLVGQEVQIGEVTFRVTQTTTRCAATEVNPASARRDVQVPRLLMKTYGHTILGIYVRALTSGELYVGDSVVPLGAKK